MMLAYEVRVQRRDSELSFEGIASCTAPIMLIHSIQEKLRSEDHTSRKSLKKCHLIVGQAFWRERELRNRLTEAGSTIEKRGTVLHHYRPTSDILTLIDLTVLFRLVSSSAIFSLVGKDYLL